VCSHFATSESATAGGLSYDDIDLFGKLRGLTVIKGLVLPPKLKAYVHSMSDKTEIPLYYQMAL
jgi:glutaredoxin 2